MLTRTPERTLTEQLAERFAERIRSRLLPVGARLPSVRECARQQGVSPYTVVAAYDQLLAQGLVEARRQRGFFVRDSVQKLPHAAGSIEKIAIKDVANASRATSPLGAAVLPMSGSHINATTLIRGMFHQASSKPQPGAGVFPPAWLEDARFMPAAVRRVTAGRALQDGSLVYGEPRGDAGLRDALARRLADLSVPAQPGQIITTVGATHALDIVSRTLLKAGDPVMVEEPGWSVEFARLDALGMRVLPVPRGPLGPDLDVMARYCEAHAPKLFVSVSVLHNPTGYSLSPGHAHQILQLANRHGFHIVEDDTYGHIAPEHATRLSALDGLRRTIYVNGFAKILAPNWRVGYLAAPPGLVERLLDTKLLSTLTTPSILEKALALCIEQGQLRRHAERMRLRLAQARARSVQIALEAGQRFAAEPAGMFGWVETGVDTDMLAQRMLDEGYLIAPGALFHATRRPCTLMRINFATTQDPGFWKVFRRAADLG
ncbi:PLP-dependent aminotransferase family protein [Paracidovorax konjaci]|uniref:DNA-binding transcriptional regulator, MocR family, contains an aminotransferase domain n=1 Tax=Paracidovorax konjaci TaxID=32040 RepID=A0A1I1Y5T0_9BURK|nr:PLP-dependent aminotransferase family protein [Paracidovorax konjaci]SFE14916.1 DNA-binding transcriptional regulator, MocR family, contains an aminotransferase domain [Paracidovorax konjaci]